MRAREWHCGPFDFDLATPLSSWAFATSRLIVFRWRHARHRIRGARVCEEAGRRRRDIIDVGGESTRPGAEEVPPEVEIARVLLRRASSRRMASR